MLVVLRAIRDRQLKAEPAVMIGNRQACRGLVEQFDVDWHMIGDAKGNPNNEKMIQLFDEYDVDYIVLARYMRVLPPAPVGSLPGDGSSICITVCSRPFPNFVPTKMPILITC